MHWEIERTDEFEAWWATLTGRDRKQILSALVLVEEEGPSARRPTVDSVKGSRYPNMKELRATRSIRVFFAFDPRRVAILLIGGDKAGRTKRFYRQMIVKADKIYEAHIRRIRKGESADGQG